MEQPQKHPYENIVAIFNGNEITIRVPKSTSKPHKLSPSQTKLQQICTCDDDASICSDSCGQSGEGFQGPANKLNFQIPDDICESLTNRTRMNSELVYTRHEAHETLCKTCGKPSGEEKPQQKKNHHEGKDVYVLRIGKQSDEPHRIGNIEVQLATPKVPARKLPPEHCCQMVQCAGDELPCRIPCRTNTLLPKKKKRKRIAKNTCCH